MAGVELREWSGLHTSRGFIFRPWMPWQRSSRQQCAHCYVNKAMCSIKKKLWQKWATIESVSTDRTSQTLLAYSDHEAKGSAYFQWFLECVADDYLRCQSGSISYMAEPLSEGQWKNVQINFFAMCFSTIELCWTFGICIVSLWGLQTKFWATMEVCETSSNAEALAFENDDPSHTGSSYTGSLREVQCTYYVITLAML